jgi:hypothetical protein
MKGGASTLLSSMARSLRPGQQGDIDDEKALRTSHEKSVVHALGGTGKEFVSDRARAARSCESAENLDVPEPVCRRRARILGERV